jgi:hypothetical protein
MRAKQKPVLPVSAPVPLAPSGNTRVPAPAPKKVSEPLGILTFSCGHQKPLAKLAGGSCEACQQQQRAAQKKASALRKQERAAVKREKKAAKRDAADEDRSRLPGGSTFAATYDAEAVAWTGQLTILSADGERQEFFATASAVFKLMAKLDGLYRVWLAEQKCDAEAVAQNTPEGAAG